MACNCGKRKTPAEQQAATLATQSTAEARRAQMRAEAARRLAAAAAPKK